MRKAEILEKLRELNQNLQDNCCGKEIIPVLKRLKSNVEPHVKLYDTVEDACNETNNFEWFLLDDILDLNNKEFRPRGITCNNCEHGCVISLKSIKLSNFDIKMFSKINKLEIIYI